MQTQQQAQQLVEPSALLRSWRSKRRLSQMELALEVGVSPRHLSFVETGRARPSAELLLALAARLDMPLRERNHLLLAHGHAPRYSQQPLQAQDMQPVRAALQRLLDAHQPYPGVVLDRHWNVVLANRAALDLTALLPPELRAAPPQPLNIMRASLHPQGMARFTSNFADWGGYLVEALHRAVLESGDAELLALEREVSAYPNVQALPAAAAPAAPALLVPCQLELPIGRLSLFTTLTSFGTPRDVTLQELCVELFYPADDETARLLRG